MQLYVPKDTFSNPHPPRLFLCNTHTTKLGELHATDIKLRAAWNQYSELSFSIDRTYIDEITGEVKVDPLFDKLEPPRRIYCEGFGYFSIQDPNIIYDDKDHKEITAFSVEYASTSTVYLDNFFVNTGEVYSQEVIYEQSKYGEDATQDVMYAMAKYDGWDANRQYFCRDYQSDGTYNGYIQVQINDEEDYHTHFGEGITQGNILYIHAYANIQFYDTFTPELSLLHLIFKNIPEWSIGHVDYSLWGKERKLECQWDNIYNVLTTTVSDFFKCHVIWDINNFRVNFYAEEDDGLTEDNDIQSEFDTDVYISRDNLAKEVTINYSADDIKTRLKVSGSDELSIREVNLGKNYIINLDYYHNLDWMEQDLYDAYQDYLDAVEEYKDDYSTAMQNWVAAYNKWDDLMNAIPADNDVLLVGDTFKKLYCIYSPIDTAYLPTTLTDSDIGTTVNNLYTLADHSSTISKVGLDNNQQFVVQGYAYLYNSTNQNFVCNRNLVPENVAALTKKLNLYHVDEDLDGDNSDNVLLTLKNNNKDSVTIRIYDPKQQANSYSSDTQYYVKNEDDTYSRISTSTFDNSLYINNYWIRVTKVNGSSGMTEVPSTYTLTQWVNGDLNTDELLSSLSDYTIKSIGSLGAYLCLAKSEVQVFSEIDGTYEPTDYLKSMGVNLLKSKQATYLTLFQAQIEEMYAQDKYQCICGESQPSGTYPNGTRWFNTQTATLYTYNGTSWTPSTPTSSDISNYENYQRYIDNYYKLQAVQQVLNEKEKEATYQLNGYAITSRSITTATASNMLSVAQLHFGNATITNGALDPIFALYTFDVSDKTYAVYLDGTTPYVSYADSEGVYQMQMNYYSQQTELTNFFNDNQYLRLRPFIREDEYTNENFLLTSYESEEERISIYNELLEEAIKELKKLAQPKLEFNMTMTNILALPEFAAILNQFALGNFIRIELRDGLVKRARLLETEVSFNDISELTCKFGNLVTTKSEIDRHADLMKQAISAGKQVATAAGIWSKGADKVNKIEEEIQNGLQDANLEVGKAYGQNIIWNDQGIFCRKLIDGTTDQYDDEQIRIINNKILYSDNAFKTAKSAFGSFTYKDQRYSGILAEAVIGGLIEGSKVVGSQIYGGDQNNFEEKLNGEDIVLNVNNKFIVNKNGEVSIRTSSSDNQNQIATKADIAAIEIDGASYTVILTNESHCVACDANGNALNGELGSSGKAVCDIIVFKGATLLTAVNGGSPSSGQFSYAIGTVIGGTAERTDADIFYLNTITADSGYIPITIYLESSSTTVTKRMSFTKSKAGSSGRGIGSITNWYALTSSTESPSTSNDASLAVVGSAKVGLAIVGKASAWSQSIPTLTAANPYLWNYEVITDSDGVIIQQTSPCIIGHYGENGTSYYTWIKYADDVNGSNMSDNPNGKTYMGIAYNKPSLVESSNASDYAWSLMKGEDGTPASLVNITPSALYFKSTTGKDGTFDPEYIYLYPSFQTISYSSWQYSLDGGNSWVSCLGADGLTIDTYNSIASSLRISRSSTLYDDTHTSISFKCVSDSASIYDIVTISKIYDVVDLETGGRNLILESKIDEPTSTNDYPCASFILSEGLIAGETYIWSVNILPSSEKKSLAVYIDDDIAGEWMAIDTEQKSTYSQKFVATSNQISATSINVYCSDKTSNQSINDTGITGTCTIYWVKLEKGNKATTDWTPAPEDLTTKISMESRLETFEESILSKVSETYQTINSSDPTKSTIEERLSTVEQTAEKITFGIDNVITNGTTNVKTSTGFTFDENGLTIEKTEGKTKSLLDEAGLEILDVRSNNNNRLFYAGVEEDNNGVTKAVVETEFIEIKKYLAIGNNSRIQDYDTNRTAVFFIGEG